MFVKIIFQFFVSSSYHFLFSLFSCALYSMPNLRISNNEVAISFTRGGILVAFSGYVGGALIFCKDNCNKSLVFLLSLVVQVSDSI